MATITNLPTDPNKIAIASDGDINLIRKNKPNGVLWGIWDDAPNPDRRMVAVGVNGMTYDVGHEHDGTYRI